MKRLIRFFARLYPQSWRDRYGMEFDAMLEDSKPGWRVSLDVLKGALGMQLRTWNPVRLVVVSTISCCLLAAGTSYALPNRYRATALLEVQGGAGGLIDAKRFTENIEESRKIGVSYLSPTSNGAVFEISADERTATTAQTLANRVASKIVDNNLRLREEDKVTAPPARFMIVQTAGLPRYPIFPNHATTSIAGVIAGLLLGLMLALFRRAPKPA